MMGDGYAIQPQSGEIYSPIDGIITTLFPTKHAIGIKNKKGLEILIHMGLDTVELEGDPFEIKVSQGQKVNKNQLIAKMNLKKNRSQREKEHGYSCLYKYGTSKVNFRSSFWQH